MSYSRHRTHYAFSNKVVMILAALLIAAFVGVVHHSKTLAVDAKNPVNLYLFWGNGCPHCAHAKEILEPYIHNHANIRYHTYEVYYSETNQKKLQKTAETLGTQASGIPFIVVGDKAYVGFSDETGNEIKSRLEYCSVRSCPDTVASAVGVEAITGRDLGDAVGMPGGSNEPVQNTEHSSDADPHYITLPILGTIDAAQFSLPALTVVIGLIDGFNPCAMWALLFIITLLIGIHDRKKMWLYGTTFIATSAAVYFLFMAAWLNLFLFIGQVNWIRIGIGLLALGIGIYYLRDWYRNNMSCKVTGNEKRRAIFTKLREVVAQKNVWIALGGIVLLAAAVNIVELACSAGLPVLYTGILSSSHLATWQYYAYMLFYIFFFMLDDLIVFTIAMTTFRITGADSKYLRATRLIGGIVMILLGALLIFAPQVLMFG